MFLLSSRWFLRLSALGLASSLVASPAPQVGTSGFEGLTYLKRVGNAYELRTVDDQTLVTQTVLSDVELLPIDLVGYALKDRLRLDQPTARDVNTATPHVRLPFGGALYRVRIAATTALLLVRGDADPRVILQVPMTSSGAAGLSTNVHVASDGSRVVALAAPELGGTLYSVGLDGDYDVVSLNPALGVDASSPRTTTSDVWCVANGELLHASLSDPLSLAVVVLDPDELVHPELLLSSSGNVLIALAEKSDGKKKPFSVQPGLPPVALDDGFEHYSAPNLDHPLGPWLAVSPDGKYVALREVLSGDKHELHLQTVGSTATPVHLTDAPDFPAYLDGIGVLAFGGPVTLCFFGADKKTGGFVADVELRDADMYAAQIGDSGIAFDNITRTNGTASPPFDATASLAFDEALVGPLGERIFLVGDTAGQRHLSCFRIDGGTDPTVENNQLLSTSLSGEPVLVGGDTRLTVLSELASPLAPNLQPMDKFMCADFGPLSQQVRILATNKVNPADTAADTWFDGVVGLGGSFEVDAANAGKNKLASDTFLHVFDLAGSLVQSVEFVTSCSEPLAVGDRYGTALLMASVGEHEPDWSVPDHCAYGSKPAQLLLRYTGDSCSATQHSQSADKVTCSGDPAWAGSVRILATDKSDPADNSADVWFDGTVQLNQEFIADAQSAGETKLRADTYVHVFDTNGALLQSVEFHTSCSQSLFNGDRFGSVELVDCVLEVPPDLDDACLLGDPRRLTMVHTGFDCGNDPVNPTIRALKPIEQGSANVSSMTSKLVKDAAPAKPIQLPLGLNVGAVRTERSGAKVAVLGTISGTPRAFVFDSIRETLRVIPGNLEPGSPPAFSQNGRLGTVQVDPSGLHQLVLYKPSLKVVGIVDMSTDGLLPLPH